MPEHGDPRTDGDRAVEQRQPTERAMTMYGIKQHSTGAREELRADESGLRSHQGHPRRQQRIAFRQHAELLNRHVREDPIAELGEEEHGDDNPGGEHARRAASLVLVSWRANVRFTPPVVCATGDFSS